MRRMLLYVVLLLSITVTDATNNIDENAYNWFTGYRVNNHRNGYLDIGDVKFNISNLKYFYTLNTNCTNNYSLFANGRIYCVSNNMLLSYNASTGFRSFWYLSTHKSLQNPIFSMSGDYVSVLIFAADRGILYISSFNAMSGGLDRTSIVKYYYSSSSTLYPPSLYPVGTSDGYIYFTLKPSDPGDVSVDAYNINTYEFIANDANITNSIYAPTICNDLVVTSGYFGQTMAYNARNLQAQWIFDGNGTQSTTAPLPAPVCIENKNGSRIIAKDVSNSNCYMLDANTGEEINQFQCGSAAPIFHYGKDNGFADIFIFPTVDRHNEVTVVEMYGDDKMFWKELWNDEGDINHGFIVDDYFVTGVKRDNQTLAVRIYNIFDGNIVWNRLYQNLTDDFTYSVFGGLVSQNYSNASAPLRLMVMTRVDDELYGYYMSEEN